MAFVEKDPSRTTILARASGSPSIDPTGSRRRILQLLFKRNAYTDSKAEAAPWPFSEPTLSEKAVRDVARMAVRHPKLNAHPQQPHYPAAISGAAASVVQSAALNRVWEEEVDAAIARRREGRAKITPPIIPSNKPTVPIQKASSKTPQPEVPATPPPPPYIEAVATQADRDAVLTAIRSKSALLRLQPIFVVASGDPYMHEAFQRLLDKNRQEIPPRLFIPLAVEHNLLPALDLLTLDLLISQMHIDTRPPPTPLAINVSRRSLTNPEYIERLHTPPWPIPVRHLSFEVKANDVAQDAASLRAEAPGRTYLHDLQPRARLPGHDSNRPVLDR